MKLGRLEVITTGARVMFTGRIDDTSPLGELWMQLPATDLTIDTAGVTFINSVGMREWVRLLRSLTGGGTRTVTLDRVADVLMTQLNLMPRIAGVRIASFHAQYASNACGAEAALLVDTTLHAAQLAKLQAPTLPCPECVAPMELADFPERYLMLFKA